MPPEDSKWGAGSWEDKLEGDNFIDIQDFLNAEKEKIETAKASASHDEL